jgi:RHS repeat-associated protein
MADICAHLCPSVSDALLGQFVSDERQYENYYEYDAAGNRTLLRHGETGAEDLTYYAYNGANELTSLHAASGWTYFAYDANGNTVMEQAPGYTRYFDWDGRDMLTGVRSTEQGWTDNVYRYDGLASRVSTLESGGLTYYDWDSINVMQEKDADGDVTDRQVHGHAPIFSVGDIALMDKSGTPYVPVSDQVGTTWNLLDSEAAKANSYAFDAFGVARSASETVGNLYRFGTKRLDADPALYHFIARQYQRKLGSFLLRDPFSSAAVRYVYASSSPLRYVDPTGLWSAGFPWSPRGEHGPMTKEVTRATFATLRPALKWYQFRQRARWGGCEKWVTGTLVRANEGVDKGKWPLSDHEKHYIRDRGWQPQEGERLYQEGLRLERIEFAARLQDDPPDCQKALQALGRLLHSWEDFFAHACRANMSCDHKNERAWLLWSTKDPTAATPDSSTDVQPAMWFGQHLFAEPTGRWPEEYAARLKAAKAYDRKEFGPVFDQWWEKCGCWCLDGRKWR